MDKNCLVVFAGESLIAGLMLGWTTSGSILASASQPTRSQADISAKFEAGLVDQLSS